MTFHFSGGANARLLRAVPGMESWGDLHESWRLIKSIWLVMTGQIIATEKSENTSFHPKWWRKVREIILFPGNLGWWNIIIWPDLGCKDAFYPTAGSISSHAPWKFNSWPLEKLPSQKKSSLQTAIFELQSWNSKVLSKALSQNIAFQVSAVLKQEMIHKEEPRQKPYPRHSMYGIFTYIWGV